jgi:AraC-like DNA-binding protein
MVTQDRREELERFSGRVLSGRSVMEMPSAFERQIGWELAGCAGSSRTITLRSGLMLSVSQVRWERCWTLDFDPDRSKLKFMIMRGPGPRVTPYGGQAHDLVSGTGHVSRIQRPVDLRFDFGEAASGQTHEELSLEVDRERLCELTGSKELPALLERVWSSSESYPFEVLTAPPASFRLLDEIVHCGSRGAARQLHLEAKGLELLAAWVDHLEGERDASAGLCAHDIERLERARQILLARMTSPPSLPELARLAGLNEPKLKAGFRAHFGDTVYGYLRQHRLEEARRFLALGRYNVTEVATRVGYSNPSKFAAAFRARFGVNPSRLR